MVKVVKAIKYDKYKHCILQTAMSITSEKERYSVIVKVKDTRTGIDPAILPQLLSKFASKSFEGNGSRLSIAESIVEAHDGNIWVENNNNINSPIEKKKEGPFTWLYHLSIDNEM